MAVTTIQPNSDINATWSRNPASGTRWDKLVDATPTTYISAPGAGAQVYQGLDFGTFTVLGTQRIRAIRVRVEYRFTAAGYFTVKVIRFGLTNSTTAIIQQASGATAGGPVYSPWMSADPGGYEWNQGSLDTYSVRLYDNATSGSRIAVYELSSEVDVRNQPTVAAPTVTGNTTSSRPRVDWVYSDSDGEDQSAWELKVFSAAQYGASGFNASTSASSYATGVRGNNGAYWVLDKDLVNGVTYQAYVRVAKQFNGQRWFSAWGVSSPFTMAYEPIPAPTLGVIPDNTVPHVRNQITVITGLNLLSSDDASFETSAGTWVNVSNTTVVTSATQFLKGAQSLRLTATAGADMVVSTGFYPCQPNRSYTFLGNFRANSTTRSCRMEVGWYDGAGTQIGSNVTGGSVTDSNANFTTQATLTATSPAGALQMKVVARVLAAAAAEFHYMDALSASTSSSTTWYAGGASGIDQCFVEFTDMAPQNALVVNLLRPQLASGGDTLSTADGFTVRSAKDIVTFDRTQSSRGEGSIRWDVGNNTGSLLDIGAPNGAYDANYTPPAVPGQVYVASCDIRAGSGTHTLRLDMSSIDQTGAVVGSSSTGSTVSVSTAWNSVAVVHTAQTGAVGLRISLDNVNGDLIDYYLDACQLEEGGIASTWHQGQGVNPSWQPVRGALTGLTTDARTAIGVCYDREAAPGVIRLYRATTIAAYASGTNGASPTSTWIPAKLGLLDAGTSMVLKDPNNPANDIRIRAPSLSEKVDEDLTETHPVRPSALNGFGQRPVISSDWISGVGGTITLQVTDDHDWYRLLQLLETKGALLLQFPEGGQRYVRLTDRSWTRDPIGVDGRVTRPSRYLRSISLSFAEVDRPPVLA